MVSAFAARGKPREARSSVRAPPVLEFHFRLEVRTAKSPAAESGFRLTGGRYVGVRPREVEGLIIIRRLE